MKMCDFAEHYSTFRGKCRFFSFAVFGIGEYASDIFPLTIAFATQDYTTFSLVVARICSLLGRPFIDRRPQKHFWEKPTQNLRKEICMLKMKKREEDKEPFGKLQIKTHAPINFAVPQGMYWNQHDFLYGNGII